MSEQSTKGTEALRVSLTPEFAKVDRENPRKNHLLVTLRGRPVEKDKERKPIRLVIAADLSGSMASHRKLDYLKASLRALVKHLGEEDYLGIVAFSNSVWTIVQPTRCSQAGREIISRSIDDMCTHSLTNLSGGAIQAIDALKGMDACRDGSIDRVLILTDGMPTAGVVDKDQLISLVRAQCGEGVTLSTFGYGAKQDQSSFDPLVLEALADCGRGNYFHIDGPDQVPKGLASEIGGLMSVVAQNIKVTLQLKDNTKVAHVLNDLDVKTDEKDGSTTISVDDLYSDEENAVTVRLDLPSMSKAVAARPKKQVGTLRVEWLDVSTGEYGVALEKISFEFVKSGEEDKTPDPKVEKQIALFKAAEAQREAIAKASKGEFPGAKSVMQEAVDGLRACALFGKDAEVDSIADACLQLIPSYDQDNYTAEVGTRGVAFARSLSRRRYAGVAAGACYYRPEFADLEQALSQDVADQMSDSSSSDPEESEPIQRNWSSTSDGRASASSGYTKVRSRR